MKLEEGKRYVRRDGSVTRPLTDDGLSIFPFHDDEYTYTENGEYYRGQESDYDLISEYIESADDKDARIAEVESARDLYMSLHALVCKERDQFKGCAIKDAMIIYNIEKERDQLKARVEELETHKAQRPTLAFHHSVLEERNSLRTQLAAVTAELEEEQQHCAGLRAELAVVVKELEARAQERQDRYRELIDKLERKEYDARTQLLSREKELAAVTAELDVERRSHRETEEEKDEYKLEAAQHYNTACMFENEAIDLRAQVEMQEKINSHAHEQLGLAYTELAAHKKLVESDTHVEWQALEARLFRLETALRTHVHGYEPLTTGQALSPQRITEETK